MDGPFTDDFPLKNGHVPSPLISQCKITKGCHTWPQVLIRIAQVRLSIETSDLDKSQMSKMFLLGKSLNLVRQILDYS